MSYLALHAYPIDTSENNIDCKKKQRNKTIKKKKNNPKVNSMIQKIHDNIKNDNIKNDNNASFNPPLHSANSNHIELKNYNNEIVDNNIH